MAPEPLISVVVLCAGMRRAVRRTLASLAPDAQRIGPRVYEIVLSELASQDMLEPDDLSGAPRNLRHHTETQGVSAAAALNNAVRRTRGPHILLCTDGACLLSPGVLMRARQVIGLSPRAVMAVHGFDLPSPPLGPSTREDQEGADGDPREDGAVLPSRPKDLFKIATWSASSRNGWFAPMTGSRAILMQREHFDAVGGFGETDLLPSGGLDHGAVFQRVTTDTKRQLFVPLGEATFRQNVDRLTPFGEAGVATADGQEPLNQAWRAPLPRHDKRIQYVGALPPQARHQALASLLLTLRGADGLEPRVPMEAVRHAEARAAMPFTPAAPRAPLTLILGMHRSGTSFLARQLVRNGWRVPGTAMAGNERSNPDGHFEPLEIVALNNWLLAMVGLSWSALGAADFSRLDDATRERMARTLQRLLLDLDAKDEATPEGGGGWVLKDPRLCRVLPIWGSAFDRMDLVPSTLFVLRRPSSVADSLQRRNGFSLDLGHLLWSRHVVDMLHWVTKADDVVCLDTVNGDDLARYIARRVGRAGISCEPVQRADVAPSTAPIDALYDAFVQQQDLEALRAGLAAAVAFLDHYPSMTARLDRLAGLPD